jgi:O-antigen/teichoic acid export membrane protein
LVKKVSIYDASGRYSELKGIIYFSTIVSVLISLVIATISAKLLNVTSNMGQQININWFVLSFLSLMIGSLLLLGQASLRGLQKIVQSQMAEKLIRPLLLIIVVVALIWFKEKINLEKLIWLNVATLGVSFLSAFIFLNVVTKSKQFEVRPKYEFRNWISSAAAFFLIAVLYILNSRVDIFILGLFRGNEEVGIYNIVLRISEILSLVLVTINFVLAPFIAKLYENRDVLQLQKLITRSARAVLMFSLPIIILVIIFSKEILNFFGADFLNGQKALLILCLGQLLNILCGSVGLLLTMSGNQFASIYSLIGGLVCNIALNFILTPKYGLFGTAIATATSLVAWNLLMYMFVRKKMKLRTTAFGVF